MIEKLLIICDEVSSHQDQYHSDMSRLKSLITNETIAVEKKGQEVQEYENYSRMICFSNNPKCFKLSTSCRRFGVFGTSDKYCKNKEAANHFLTYLLHYDLSKWDHNKIPNTEERLNMMISNELYFLFYEFNSYDSEGRVTTEEFYKQYVDYCINSSIKPINKLKIISQLKPYVECHKFGSGIRGFTKKFKIDENDKVNLIK
jgi:hypothetical protein